MDEITDAMIEAAMRAWSQPDHNWDSLGAHFKDSLRRRMRQALVAAVEAAPSGHGERG